MYFRLSKKEAHNSFIQVKKNSEMRNAVTKIKGRKLECLNLDTPLFT